MAQTLTLISQYRAASLEVDEIIENMKEDLAKLRQSSEEKWILLRHYFSVKLKTFQQIIQHYRHILNSFPRELKKRPAIKEALLEIESVEQSFRKFSNSISQFSIKEEWDQSLIQFQKKMDHLNHQIELFEAHPLVQKFLRGEPVLSSRNTIQWGRKFGHMAFGMFFLFLFYYSGLPKTIVWAATGAFLVWAYSLEIARHLNPRVNDWVCKNFKGVMREAEKTRINSGIFYITAMVAVYFIFPKPVTIITMFFVAVGDTVAGVVGVLYGKTKIAPRISLEGFLACYATCFLSAFFTMGYAFDKTLSGIPLLTFSLLAGCIGAVAESSFKKIDDNLMIPLLSAPLLYILMYAFGVL